MIKAFLLSAIVSVVFGEDIQTSFGLTMKDDGSKTIVVRSNSERQLNANVTEDGSKCKIVIVGLRAESGRPSADIEVIKKGMVAALKKDEFVPQAESQKLDDMKVSGKTFQAYDCKFTVKTGTVRTIILLNESDDAVINLTIYNPTNEDFPGTLEKVVKFGE